MQTLVLTNASGMEVTISTFGARIASIKLPVGGDLKEMTVVPDKPEQLKADPFYLGAICGPVCNRIANAKFDLNGCTYHLPKNDGENCLHGGVQGISGLEWQVAEQTTTKVTLALSADHLADGFPGRRDFEVVYELTEQNRLNIEMSAQTDTDTPINLTNHAYFNLGESSALPLQLNVQSDEFLRRHGNGLPTGELEPCLETGYDIKQWQSVADLIDFNKYPQMAQEQGVDHCFVLNQGAENEPKAQLRSAKTGVMLSVFSNQDAMQVYTGKFLGEPFSAYQGLCLESQGFTDAVNHPHFPSVVLKQGERYRHLIGYQFEIV